MQLLYNIPRFRFVTMNFHGIIATTLLESLQKKKQIWGCCGTKYGFDNMRKQPHNYCSWHHQGTDLQANLSPLLYALWSLGVCNNKLSGFLRIQPFAQIWMKKTKQQMVDWLTELGTQIYCRDKSYNCKSTGLSNSQANHYKDFKLLRSLWLQRKWITLNQVLWLN